MRSSKESAITPAAQLVYRVSLSQHAKAQKAPTKWYHTSYMVKTTVYLDDETVAALKGISRRSAKPQAQLIRDALRAFAVDAERPPLPAGLGMFDSGNTDTSARRKELLKEAARSRRWRS